MSFSRSCRTPVFAVSTAALLAGFALASAPGAAVAQAADQDARPERQVFASPFGEPFIAEPGEPYPVVQWFEGADTDQDGRLTPEELAADGLRWFAIVDQNGDGVIGPEENRAYEATISRLFASITLPGAGGASAGGGRRPRFSRDRTSLLSLGESGQAMPEPVERPIRRTYVQSSTPLAQAGLLNVPQPVKAADTNTDQRITQAEWEAVTVRWFGLLDTVRDGVLTLAELPETQLQVLAREPSRRRGRR